MTISSRISGFYKLSIEARERVLREQLGFGADALMALGQGGISLDVADKMIENVIGLFSLPFALGLNLQMNGKDFLVPMVVEEPSVVAAASNASRMVREGGGFVAESDDPVMISQVQLDDVPDAKLAIANVLEHREELLRRADASVPNLVRRGGGARGIEARDLGDGMVVVHFLIDCRDAMGANLVNTVAESVADRLAELTRGKVGLRILSNLADHRCVRIRCSVPTRALADKVEDGPAVRDGVVRASRFAEADPYRATTHNKGIMNGIDPVVLATGNDWRAAEAGAHAFAARSGQYKPLCIWRKGDNGNLEGKLEVPLALGIVGGPARMHKGAALGLKLANVETAQELAMLAGCVGMASNLAALRALATDGIQRGHMGLHARQVAVAAGALGDEVEQVAKIIHAQGHATLDAATEALKQLRGR
ncbi:MAG TPA: hydroxymethylglutaryl-CoA reductase, degradative [Polyangiales bacterium]|nr:hydroxymethylglutaryl-CoA reductase, degradative [Polyangiales bacterium]